MIWILLLLVYLPGVAEPARLTIAPPFETYLECQQAMPALYDAVVPAPGVRIEAACATEERV